MQETGPVREEDVGVVTHYWSHLGVAGVHLTAPLDAGDRIHILGHTSDFEQTVGSMEMEHQHIEHAESGADVGIRVVAHAREHDHVYKITCADSGGPGMEL